MSLREYLTAQQKIVDQELDRLVPPETTPPETIHRAMRYSLFAGGKRIRPILSMESARAVSDETEGVVTAACSLELVHTYSLIHDDLPALDNDDLRRGKPTCHKMFGDAMAILAGDALLTFAFQVLAEMDASAEVQSRLVVELATAAGTPGGMIDGQVHDLEGERKPPDARLLDSIHRAKTGAMLRSSIRMGAIYAGATAERTRRAFLLRRTRRPRLSDRRRRAGCRGILRSARQNRRQGRRAAQDHLPRRLRPRPVPPHGRTGAAARAQHFDRFGPRATACANWPT